MSSAPVAYLTPEQYLELERKAEFRSEYHDGEVFPMTGATRWHSLIGTNLVIGIGNRLTKSSCEVHASTLRLRVSTTGLYTYPDIMVICDEPVFADMEKDILLNPAVIIEVLSESTKDYDRGQKFQHYRTIDSVRDYLAISQTAAHVEHFSRQSDGRWLLSDVKGLESSVILEFLNISLPLSEIYRKVQWS